MSKPHPPFNWLSGHDGYTVTDAHLYLPQHFASRRESTSADIHMQGYFGYKGFPQKVKRILPRNESSSDRLRNLNSLHFQIERTQPGGIPAEKHRLIGGKATVQLLGGSSNTGRFTSVGVLRGFLPRGLCDTCPQVGGGRRSGEGPGRYLTTRVVGGGC